MGVEDSQVGLHGWKEKVVEGGVAKKKKERECLGQRRIRFGPNYVQGGSSPE